MLYKDPDSRSTVIKLSTEKPTQYGYPLGPNIVVVVDRCMFLEVIYVIKSPIGASKWWSL